jgi:hypothetical protein
MKSEASHLRGGVVSGPAQAGTYLEDNHGGGCVYKLEFVGVERSVRESTAMEGGSLILGGGQRTVEALIAVRGFLEGLVGLRRAGVRC